MLQCKHANINQNWFCWSWIVLFPGKNHQSVFWLIMIYSQEVFFDTRCHFLESLHYKTKIYQHECRKSNIIFKCFLNELIPKWIELDELSKIQTILTILFNLMSRRQLCSAYSNPKNWWFQRAHFLGFCLLIPNLSCFKSYSTRITLVPQF